MGKKLTTEDWIKKAKELHGDKYNYDNVVYTKAKGKVKIFCNAHKEFFFQQAYNHTIGHGCVLCAVEEQHAPVKEQARQDFYRKAVLAHGDKYDYSKVDYKNNHTKVEIVCKKHGSFFQSPNSHTGVFPHGCPKCGVEQNILKQRKTIEQFLKDAWDIHGKEHYNYDKVDYKGAWKPVVIYCNIHCIDFTQAPAAHAIMGHGCSICSQSQGESRIMEVLTSYNIKIETQSKFSGCRYKKSLKFDFYLHEHDLCIEYQGEQHYKPVRFGGISEERAQKNFNKQQIKDQIKRDYCKNNNIKLIEIPYWDFDKIEQILIQELKLKKEEPA